MAQIQQKGPHKSIEISEDMVHRDHQSPPIYKRDDRHLRKIKNFQAFNDVKTSVSNRGSI